MKPKLAELSVQCKDLHGRALKMQRVDEQLPSAGTGSASAADSTGKAGWKFWRAEK